MPLNLNVHDELGRPVILTKFSLFIMNSTKTIYFEERKVLPPPIVIVLLSHFMGMFRPIVLLLITVILTEAHIIWAYHWPILVTRRTVAMVTLGMMGCSFLVCDKQEMAVCWSARIWRS